MKRAFWIILVLVILGGAGFLFTRDRAQQAFADTVAELQTEEAKLGALVATVGATGTVRANQSALLTWETSGLVDEVLIGAGDQVQSGDVLATLMQTSLPQNIILAEADLLSNQQALEDLYELASGLDIAQAAQSIADSTKVVEDAQRYLDNITTPARQTDIDQASSTVVLSRDRLDKAQDNFAPYENKSEDNLIRANLLSALAKAQTDYDSAVSRLNALQGVSSATTIAIAEADLTLAKASLADAEEQYQELLGDPSNEDIAVAEARISAAQATLNQAFVQAPFSGTITQAHPKTGDRISPNLTAFRLDDLSQMLVDVSVSEIDINRIQVGQEVILTFDAILAKEYHGIIEEVGIIGESQQGVVSFNVTVTLIDSDEQVKPGMTAGVNIVVSQLEEALLIPNRAVRVLDGERVVYVLENGEIKPVQVTLGSSSDTHSEVLDTELQVGDLIILNPPTIFQGGPGGGGGPFGGRG